MGRATSQGNEAKLKMKHPSGIASSGFEPKCYTSVANRDTSLAQEASCGGYTIKVSIRNI